MKDDEHVDDDGVDDDLVVDQDDDNLFQKIGAFYFRNGPDSGCLAVVDGVGGYASITIDNFDNHALHKNKCASLLKSPLTPQSHDKAKVAYTVGDRVFAMDLTTWTTEDLGPVRMMMMRPSRERFHDA